ncbi:MAG: tRNA preQ1(34) S-adenosylmethionine ribosyltransferase-isomerase QueA [Gammaproteobacteria bacterium RIFCSPLOWO2_02_FULL_61_13]|nr:MAG: tRNA preQ1(34) S-adenosylmethionine ribosyltransferase-isomerase QueA [Gammaproteobacteria bacterium RIFCSPLOWO2_02_FULL_61_13]
MLCSDFDYELPPDLIAQHPAEPRDSARMLLLSRQTGHIEHRGIRDFPDCLRAGDLLVLNDTRVIPARLFGRKQTGGRMEILVERLRGEQDCLAQLRDAKSARSGTRITIDDSDDACLEVLGREGEFFMLRRVDGGTIMELLDKAGHVPLPPYIDRDDEPADREQYQTIFARRPGAVAAPTAGLHFTPDLLAAIGKRGVETGYVTLHVGAGTFQPLRSEVVESHRMHSEWYEVNELLCEQAEQVRQRGGRIVAVGTTSVRCLESAALGGALQPARGETDIFIYPGFGFRTVDAMLTNFHLPRSTLLMLVCAFAGREWVLAAYREAVQQRYRFFSYGDAMFIA